MNMLVWIIFGGIAGWIASVVMKTDSRQEMVTDIVMGIIGAVVGGLLMGFIGEPGVTGFNLYSFLVAIFGASVVIYISRLIQRR